MYSSTSINLHRQRPSNSSFFQSKYKFFKDTKQFDNLREIGTNLSELDCHKQSFDEVVSFLLGNNYNEQEINKKIQQSQYNVYFGKETNGKKNGFGYIKYTEDAYYFGQWKNNLFDGAGVYSFGKNDKGAQIIYAGSFSAGKMEGQGVLFSYQYTDMRVIYRGFWKDNLKSGKGIYYYDAKNEIIYVGQWMNDVKNGPGRLIFQGNEYVGGFKDDLREGLGVMVTAISKTNIISIYDGNWVKDEINQGKIKYHKISQEIQTDKVNDARQIRNGAANISRAVLVGQYEGGIKAGLKNGIGKYNQIQTHTAIQGEFNNDLFIDGTVRGKDFTLMGKFDNKKMILDGSSIDIYKKRFQGRHLVSQQQIIREIGKMTYRDTVIAGDFSQILDQWIGKFQIIENGKVNQVQFK